MQVPPSDASLADVAAYMAAPGRGILASDESTGTIGRRLETVGLANDEVRELYLLLLLLPDPGMYGGFRVRCRIVNAFA